MIEWIGTHAEYDKQAGFQRAAQEIRQEERCITMKQQIRVIKTQRDYDAAIGRLSALMDKELASGSNAEAELELLALVIESYERSKIAPVSPDPIEATWRHSDEP